MFKLLPLDHYMMQFLEYIWYNKEEYYNQCFIHNSLDTIEAVTAVAEGYNSLRTTLSENTQDPPRSPFPYIGNPKLSGSFHPYRPYGKMYVVVPNPIAPSAIPELQLRIEFHPLKGEDSYLALPHLPYLCIDLGGKKRKLPTKQMVQDLLAQILDLELRARNLYMIFSHWRYSVFDWEKVEQHPEILPKKPVWIGRCFKVLNLVIEIHPKSKRIKVYSTPSPKQNTENFDSHVWEWYVADLDTLSPQCQKSRAVSFVNYLKGIRRKNSYVDLGRGRFTGPE